VVLVEMVELVELVELVERKVVQELVDLVEMPQDKEVEVEVEVDALVIQYPLLLQTMTLPAEEQVVEGVEQVVEEVQALVEMGGEVQMEIAILELLVLKEIEIPTVLQIQNFPYQLVKELEQTQ
jgi:hypothetical protein